MLAFVVLVAASSSSCKAKGSGPFVGSVSRSQFFEYHDHVDEPLCPTLLSLLDAHAQQIGGKIGLQPDPARPFVYYKFRDIADLESSAGCSLESAGCALGDALYSTTYFDAHEQAHDYVFRAWGEWSTGLLNEGEAVALSCKPGYTAQPTVRPRDVLGDPAWRDLLYLYGSSVEAYLAAGFWMTHLAERYGWERARELHRRIRPGISTSDFEREFARVYPISMDEAWSAALEMPGAAPCENDWACGSLPLAVGDQVTPDCDGQMHVSISVADQGGVALTVGGIDSEIVLRSCASPDTPRYELVGGSTARTTHFAALPAGTYTLFSAPAPADVEFASYLPPGFNAATCDAAGSITIDPSQVTYVDLLANTTSGWIKIAGGGHTYRVQPYNLLWPGWPAASGAPALCDGCGAAATCVPLPGGVLTSVVIGDGAALRLVGASAQPASTLYGNVIFLPGETGDAGP